MGRGRAVARALAAHGAGPRVSAVVDTGRSAFMPIAMAIPMALQLLPRRSVRCRSGSTCGSCSCSGGRKRAHAVRRRPWGGAGGGGSRLLVFSYRFAWHLTITIVLLWVMNLGERPSRPCAVRLMGVMFLVTVAGGWLGLRPQRRAHLVGRGGVARRASIEQIRVDPRSPCDGFDLDDSRGLRTRPSYRSASPTLGERDCRCSSVLRGRLVRA